MSRDLTAERDARVIPVARELLRHLAMREDLYIGARTGMDAEKAAQYYQAVYKEEVIPLLLEHNLKLNEVSYLFQLMQQAIDFTRDVTNSSIEMNRDLADALNYGLKDIDDLTVIDLDATLKRHAETVDKPVDK